MSTENSFSKKDIFEGPQSTLEVAYIEEYLKSKGHRWADLCQLVEEEAKALMTEACRYATIKLAEHEARAQFRREIHVE